MVRGSCVSVVSALGGFDEGRSALTAESFGPKRQGTGGRKEDTSGWFLLLLLSEPEATVAGDPTESLVSKEGRKKEGEGLGVAVWAQVGDAGLS